MENNAKPNPGDYGLTETQVVFLEEPKLSNFVKVVSRALISFLVIFLLAYESQKNNADVISVIFSIPTIIFLYFLIVELAFPKVYVRWTDNWKKFCRFKADLLNWKTKQFNFWNNLDHKQFELAVAKHYINMGYSVRVVGGANDKGIDVIATKPGEEVFIQCKKHSKNIGPAVVREFIGALSGKNNALGVIYVLNGFSREAIILARRCGIDLKSIRTLIESTDYKGLLGS